MKVAIIQPNYIPWKGYFDIIHDVDTFVFLDDVQYTVRDWRNRNQIRLPGGGKTWLSVPVVGGRNQRIDSVAVDESQGWRRKHLEALRHSYGRAPHFEPYYSRFAAVLERPWPRLVDLDVALTEMVCDWLGCRRRFERASTLQASGSKDDRLIELVQRVGGDHYLSGPSARDYIVPEKFAAAGITLAYHDYAGYPEYPQIASPFDPYVSILDLMFAVGDEAPELIWGSRRQRSSAG
jgi:hypothetical protein